jgi:hypothetical protein
LIKQQHDLQERFTFSRPLSFFLQISDSRLCLELLSAAEKLEERVSEVHSFAKTMQYIKTFDEEYVDVVLEVFERHHLLEEASSDNQAIKMAWEKYARRMYYACSLAEEEIILDIGLLDMRALMDVDQANLRKVLKIAIDRTRQHMRNPEWGLLKRLEQSPSSQMKLYQELQEKIAAWDKEPLLPEASSTELLEKLKLFCYYLFNAAALLSAVKKHRLAKILVLIEELRAFCRALELWLQKKRGAMGASWNKLWIAECYAIRREIEHFEMQGSGIESLKAFVSRFFVLVSQIPEIAQLKALKKEEADFEKMTEEIKRHLEEIGMTTLFEADQMPFFFVPGYLAFFIPENVDERSVR